MELLIAGILLWSVTHLFPSVARGTRDKLAGALGENLYKGLYSFDILLAVVLIVWGWKAATATAIYNPPLFGSPLILGLMLIAFILFVASGASSNIKRFVRHPQMVGVIAWAIAHLLTNGDSRSIVLFGGLGIWAILEILLINRRDGEWQKPGPVAITADGITLVIGLLAFAAVFYFHGFLFGAALI